MGLELTYLYTATASGSNKIMHEYFLRDVPIAQREITNKYRVDIRIHFPQFVVSTAVRVSTEQRKFRLPGRYLALSKRINLTRLSKKRKALGP